MCEQIQRGHEAYKQTLDLRSEILRVPLGLAFSPEELAEEKEAFHVSWWHETTLVGCLVLKPLSEKRLRMRQLAVREDCRGRGVGRALVNCSESFARMHVYEEMVLHARESAVGFYRKMGYEVEGERYLEITLPHFTMRKKLSARGEEVVAGECGPGRYLVFLS